MEEAPLPSRTVFFISDGTGITAETFGHAILAQFEMKAKHIRLPFIDRDRKSTRLNSSHSDRSRMPSSA